MSNSPGVPDEVGRDHRSRSSLRRANTSPTYCWERVAPRPESRRNAGGRPSAGHVEVPFRTVELKVEKCRPLSCVEP